MLAAMGSSGARPVYLIEIAFADETVRAWTGGGGDISWNSQTWSGIYAFAQIDAIPASGDASAQRVSIHLGPLLMDDPSGTPGDLLGTIIATEIRDRPVTIWQGALDTDGSIIEDPFGLFVGRMDQRIIHDSGPTSTIELICVSELEDGDRATRYRLSPARLGARGHAGDKGFDFVAAISEPVEQEWPAAGYWERYNTP